ncbi:hypothetical protein D9M71_628490 [compost metagenome]
MRLDQPQQQIELQRPAARLAIATDGQYCLTTHQPVPRHQIWTAAQQVQISTRTHDADEAAIVFTLNLVGAYCLAGRCLCQLHLQTQHTPGGQLVTGLQYHQPFTR